MKYHLSTTLPEKYHSLFKEKITLVNSEKREEVNAPFSTKPFSMDQTDKSIHMDRFAHKMSRKIDYNFWRNIIKIIKI